MAPPCHAARTLDGTAVVGYLFTFGRDGPRPASTLGRSRVNIPRSRLALGAVTAAALTLGTVTTATASGPNPRSTQQFQDAVSVAKIERHLASLQAIADEHGDPRRRHRRLRGERPVRRAGARATRATRHRAAVLPVHSTSSCSSPRSVTVNGADPARASTTHVMSGEPEHRRRRRDRRPARAAHRTALGCNGPVGLTSTPPARSRSCSRGACSFLEKSQAAADGRRRGGHRLQQRAPASCTARSAATRPAPCPSSGITQEQGKALAHRDGRRTGQRDPAA